MDWLIAGGGIIMMVIGLIGLFRPELLWRLYSLEKRWRKNNPEQPEDWQKQATKQGLFLIGFGLLFVMLAFVLG